MEKLLNYVNTLKTIFLILLDVCFWIWRIHGELDSIIKESVSDYYYQIPNFVNISSFGADSEGNTNSTKAFQEAISYMKLKGITGFYIPTGTYKLDVIQFPDNITVYGSGSTLLLNLLDEKEIVEIGSNSEIKDLTFRCLNTNKEWNRIDLSNKENITFENCIIQGFRNPGVKNAWGLYMKNSKNIVIRNCKFDDNTQSDIAITENTENVIIENCSALNDYFKINLEPNGTSITKNVTIKGSKVSFLTVLGNSPSVYNNQDVKLYDNDINELMLQNCSIELVNNDIKDLRTTIFSNKIIKNINSIGYEKELNNDVSLTNIQPGETTLTNCWKMGYSPSVNSLKREENNKGKVLKLNPDLAKTAVSIERTYQVNPGEQYSITALMNTIHPVGSEVSGRGLNIFFTDVSGNSLEKINFIIDRTNIELAQGGETEWNEKTCFVTVPETATSMRVLLSNYTTSSGAFATQWGTLKLKKINLKNKYVSPSKLETYGSQIPNKVNSFGNYNLGLKGDIIFLDNGNFAGCCTESGNPGTWKTI